LVDITFLKLTKILYLCQKSTPRQGALVSHGRSKKNRGHVKPIVCTNCGRLVGKDKAIKRFSVRDMIDSSSKKDIRDAIPYENASNFNIFIIKIII
jgi:ribosomal protein S26